MKSELLKELKGKIVNWHAFHMGSEYSEISRLEDYDDLIIVFLTPLKNKVYVPITAITHIILGDEESIEKFNDYLAKKESNPNFKGDNTEEDKGYTIIKKRKEKWKIT